MSGRVSVIRGKREWLIIIGSIGDGYIVGGHPLGDERRARHVAADIRATIAANKRKAVRRAKR